MEVKITGEQLEKAIINTLNEYLKENVYYMFSGRDGNTIENIIKSAIEEMSDEIKKEILKDKEIKKKVIKMIKENILKNN